MRIYIDEAGPFAVPPSTQSLFSLVLAVVIPSCVEGALFAEFSASRDGWSNQGGEVKGSKLDESQAAQLIELASRYDVFVNIFAIDMAKHDDAVVSAYKSRQADAVIARIKLSTHINELVRFKLHELADMKEGVTYREMILPRLAEVTVPTIAKTLNVSEPYAANVRKGQHVPHPMHWQALAELVRVSGPC